MEIVYRNGSLICIIINLQLYGLRYLRELYVSSNYGRCSYGYYLLLACQLGVIQSLVCSFKVTYIRGGGVRRRLRKLGLLEVR